MASTGAIRASRAFVELFADTTKLQQGLRQAENILKEFSTRATTLGRTVTAAAGIMIAPVAMSIRTFYRFDDNMREVQAVTQATVKEFEKLSEKAKQLGRDTSFTAIQVSQAMATMGRAGFKSNEIDDAIAAVLNLARATRTDLNDAARITTLSMRGFAMGAEEMTRVSDVLSVTSNAAALDLMDFGESMKYVAPIARQAGMDIEDAAASIAILSNFGIRGSMAGTGLKNILSRMANSDVAKKFNEIGVQTKDAEGNLRSFVDILYDVAQATQYMGSGDRMEVFKNLADLRALPAFAVSVENPEKIVKMIDVLRSSMDKASEMSALMDAGLGGSFRFFISAVESAAITLAEVVSGPLQKYMEMLKRGVNWVNSWVKSHARAVLTYSKGVLGLMALGGAIYGVGKAVQIASNSLALMRGALAGVSGAMGIATKALMEYSGVGELVRKQNEAVQAEVLAQRQLGKVTASLDKAHIRTVMYTNILKEATQGTRAYTRAHNSLARAMERENALIEEVRIAQEQYTAAHIAAVKATQAANGGGFWAVMSGTYHRLGGQITRYTNLDAGMVVLDRFAAAMDSVGRAALAVGRSLMTPFLTAARVWRATANVFVSVWTNSIGLVSRALTALGRLFTLSFWKSAFIQLGQAVKSIGWAVLNGWIASIGVAAKASAVGIGVLKASFVALKRVALPIAGILAAIYTGSRIMQAGKTTVDTSALDNGMQNLEQYALQAGELQKKMESLQKLAALSAKGPLSDEAFKYAKTVIDELNASVQGLGLSYDELGKTINVANDAQKKLTEAQKTQLIDLTKKQIEDTKKAIETISTERENYFRSGVKGKTIVDTTPAGMISGDEKDRYGSAHTSLFDPLFWHTSALSAWGGLTNTDPLKKKYDESMAQQHELEGRQAELEARLSTLTNTDQKPGESAEEARQRIVEKEEARFNSEEFSAEENPVDALLKGSGAMSGIDSNLSPAEKIKAINEKLKKDTEAVRGEMNKITEEFATTIGEAPDTVLGDFLKKLPEMMRKTPEEFRTFLEETRNAIIDRRNALGEAFKKGEITEADYTKAIGQLGGANAALPGFERYYQMGALAGVTIPSHKEITEGKSLEEVVGLSGISQGRFGLAEYDRETGAIIPVAESNKIISFKDFKPSEQYQTYEDYIKAVSKKMTENPEAFYKEELGHYLDPNEDIIQDIRKLGEVLPQMVNVQTILGETIEGSLSKAAKQQIDEIAKEQIAGIEEYTRPMESERQAELRRSAEEYQKQYDNVEGIAAALQASGKTITYGELTADGSNLITLKQILDMQREERDAEINEKYDKEVAEGIAEAMRASGASAIDIARVAYGEDTSGAVPQADVSKFENAIAEADRAFNAGEISEYESDVAKYNALVGERDALLNSGDLKFLGKKLEDAQEVYKQALEAYEQENSDENAKALQEAAQALEQISDEYEGAYDTMLGSIDDALQDLENKSYQEENENAGFERAKVEYGSRGSFSAYEGSSLGESQIDIRIEKNTAETVTLLRDTFHWWKQMYEPQSVFA